MTVHLDTREPRDLIKAAKLVLGDDQVIVRTLDSGDIAFWDNDGHSLGIERKAGGDLVSSLSNKKKQANGQVRLLNQLSRMKEEYTHRALLLEGVIDYIPNLQEQGGNWALGVNRSGNPVVSDWSWLSMQMMIWSFEQDGIKMFWVPNKDATVELIRGLNNRTTGCVLHGIKSGKTNTSKPRTRRR